MADIPLAAKNNKDVDDRSQQEWSRWVMQTARSWDDIDDIIKKTGIESIDYDHRQMTEVVLEINNLIDMYDEDGLRLENIRGQQKILDTLYSYAHRHFTREINIIEKYDLPSLNEQQKQHQIFLDMLTGYMDDFSEGRLTVSVNLKNAVLEWWVGHINGLDNETFSLKNWTNVAIQEARSWDDVSEIIKTMGIQTIDREHREMTEIALEIIGIVDIAKAQGKDAIDWNKLDNIFARLQECAYRHFAFEENFIAEHNLPDLKKQENQHHRFHGMLDGFRSDLAKGNLSVSGDLQFQILKWWVTHINEVDYNAFSLEKWAHVILANIRSWEQANEYISKTGIEEIDEDHRKITKHIIEIDELIERFDNSQDVDSFKEQGSAFFEKIVEFCQSHFIHEEALMKSNDFSGLRHHKEQHNHFLMLMANHKDDFINGRVVASKRMKKFILDWWVAHIKDFDMPAFGDLTDVNKGEEN